MGVQGILHFVISDGVFPNDASAKYFFALKGSRRKDLMVPGAQRQSLPTPSYGFSSIAMPECCVPRTLYARHVAIPGAAPVWRTQRIATYLWALNTCRLALGTQTGIIG